MILGMFLPKEYTKGHSNSFSVDENESLKAMSLRNMDSVNSTMLYCKTASVSGLKREMTQESALPFSISGNALQSIKKWLEQKLYAILTGAKQLKCFFKALN